MKVNGRMIRRMVMAHIIEIKIMQYIRVIGLMINNMVMVRRHGQMDHLMKVIMWMVRRMVRESSNGLMAIFTLENF